MLKRVGAGEQALVQSQEALAEHERELTQRQQQLQQVEADHSRALAEQNDQSELEQENELLLLQLHQVQEELERYFLKYREVQGQQEQFEARWQRMLQRNPDYFGYADCKVRVEGVGPDQVSEWRFKEVDVVGARFDELVFSVVLRQGMAGIRWQRDSLDGTGGLLRWPEAHEQDLSCELNAETAQSQRDWLLLRRLPGMLEQVLAEPLGTLPDGLEVSLLGSALRNLAGQLREAKPQFRFDRVELKNEQVNPDYEHLWLRFEGVGFGEKRWPEFECRVACANVGPGRFGTHPKLEFPASCKDVLEGWYAESSDDFGEKLELRFAVPEQMDVGVWQCLSERDKRITLSIVERLSYVLKCLLEPGAEKKEGVQKWSKLLAGVNNIINDHVAF